MTVEIVLTSYGGSVRSCDDVVAQRSCVESANCVTTIKQLVSLPGARGRLCVKCIFGNLTRALIIIVTVQCLGSTNIAYSRSGAVFWVKIVNLVTWSKVDGLNEVSKEMKSAMKLSVLE